MAENWFDTLGLDDCDDIPHYQMCDNDVLTDEDYTPDMRPYTFGLLSDFEIIACDVLGISSLSLLMLSLDLRNQFDAY